MSERTHKFKEGDKVRIRNTDNLSSLFERDVPIDLEGVYIVQHVSNTSPFVYIYNSKSKDDPDKLKYCFSATEKDLISEKEYNETIAVSNFHDWLSQ